MDKSPNLTPENLVLFEKEFFIFKSFLYQRYGQAVINHFNLNEIQEKISKPWNLFYLEDEQKARTLVWVLANGGMK